MYSVIFIRVGVFFSSFEFLSSMYRHEYSKYAQFECVYTFSYLFTCNIFVYITISWLRST